MKLVVGLGNPGKEYENTRHNVGFMTLKKLRSNWMLDKGKKKFHGKVSEGLIKNVRVLLLEPQTYMNKSGLSVAEVSRFYKIDPEDILVVVDDIALPVGKVRLRPKGSAGGHNGLKDIQRVLGTNAWPRLRLGVGEPKIGEHRINQADYVLARFTDEDMMKIRPGIRNACEAIEYWLSEGVDIAMNRCNIDPQD